MIDFHHRAPLSAVALVLLLGAGACSDEQQAEPPATEVQLQALPDEELVGVNREDVIITIPWNEVLITHELEPGQVRATLTSVELSAPDGFDRATFLFEGYSTLPAYQISWADSTGVPCMRGPSPAPERRLLVVELTPAMASDSASRPKAAADASGGPITANQVCTENDRLVWTMEGATSPAVRAIELRNPPRLIVDMRRAPSAPADSTAATTP